MLGQGSLGIGITMFLRDQFTGPAAKIRNSAASTAKELKELRESELRNTRNLNAGLAMVGAGAMIGIGKAITMAANFGKEMEFVKTVTQATRAETIALGEQAKQLGQDTMFYSQDVAEGMRYMALSAGLSVQQVQGSIGAAVALAGATMNEISGMGGAADVLTSVMNVFKVSTEDSAAAADIIAWAVTRSKTSLSDFGEAMKYAGSTAMDLNISLTETSAMAMVLANAGIRGSMSGVAMENTMRYISNAMGVFGSGKQKKALDLIGLSKDDITDSKGNMVSMVDVIQKVGGALEKTFGPDGGLDKNGVLAAIFGVRGKRAASPLIRNLKEFGTFVDDLNTKAPGHSQRVMAEMMQTMWGYIDRVKSAFENLAISFGQGLEPTIKILLGTIEKIVVGVQWLFKGNRGVFFSHAIAGFIVLKTVTWAYRAVVAGLTLMHAQMGSMMSVFGFKATTAYNASTSAAMRYVAAARMAQGVNLGNAAGSVAYMGMNRNVAGALYRTKTTGFGKAGQMVGGAVAARYAQRYALKGATARLAAGGAGSALVGATSVIGKTLGFLAGPWGMALAFILPGVIGLMVSASKKNTEALENQTETQRRNNELISKGRIGAIDNIYDNRQRLYATRDVGVKDLTTGDITPNGFKTFMSKFNIDKSRLEPNWLNSMPEIKLYIDGREIIGAIKPVLDNIDRRQNYNAG